MNRKTNYCVRWHDGTYDPYNDNYKEVVSKKSYWDWVEGNAAQDEDGVYIESPLANPDSLSGADTVVPVLDEQLDQLRNEAFDSLSPRQKEVWDLVMRQGFPQEEAAAKLGITRDTLKTQLSRAKAAFTAYLREHTSNG